MKALSNFFPATVLLSAHLSAATVANWEFNDLTDSSGNGHTLTNANTQATISGGQAVFSSTTATGILSAADDAAWDDRSFTVESIFTYLSPGATNIATIAAHLSTNTGRQWLFGINGSAVPYVILGGSSGGGSNVEVGKNSSFGALTSGDTYYFGAVINLDAVNDADKITFYFKDITNGGMFMSDTSASTTLDTFLGSSAPLSIGSTGHSSSRFLGSIDQVRISDTILASNQLLVVPEPSQLLLSLAGISLLAVRRRC